MRNFVTPAKLYGALGAVALAVLAGVGVIVKLSTDATSSAAKAETAPAIAEIRTEVQILKAEQNGIKASVGELDRKFTTQIGEVKTKVDGVEGQITTTRGELARKIDGVEAKTDKVIDLLISGRR